MKIVTLLFKKKLARSNWGNFCLILFLLISAAVMILPFIYTISTALKPANELWKFPPDFLVRNPTLKNFTDLFSIMADSRVPFSRYIFNTVIVTVFGTMGNIFISSLCAYPISKYKFPFSQGFFNLVQTALLFSGTVTAIPSYFIISKLRLLDTAWALIIPACGAPLGLFVMKQFMDQTVNISILESASIDGAGEMRKFFSLVMPMVKPAWPTLMILTIQGLWSTGETVYIYSEQGKTLNYALKQIQSAGVARMGVGGAATVLTISVPLIVFILFQSNIMETFSTSGMKE